MKLKFKQTEIGMIPEDWKESKIGTKCKIKNGKTNSQDAVEEGIYPLFDRSLKIKKSNKYLFDCEAIIIPGEGKEFIPRYFRGKFDLHQRAYAIWKKDVYVDLKFIHYWILKNKDYLARIAVGSTVKSLRLNHLENFPLGLPNPKEQRAIAKILSDLDSKIELLKKQNATLEKIGQAIFKHWFIDFEFPNEEGKPYKSSGGEMVFNEELGKEIPRGWEVKMLKELFEFVKGKKPKDISEEYKENYLPQILIETLDGKKPFFANPEKMVIVDENFPIMVMDGASSGRIETGFKGVLGSTLAMLKINNKHFGNAVYYFLKNKEEDIKQNTTGTSIPHTDKNKVYDYQITIPKDISLLDRFQRETSQLINKIIQNKQQIQTLQKIRDPLLPRLMSGKIRVPVEVRA